MPSIGKNIYGSWLHSSPEEIRRNFLEHECSASLLESIAKTENLEDPRRSIAREIIEKMYKSVFGDEKR